MLSDRCPRSSWPLTRGVLVVESHETNAAEAARETRARIADALAGWESRCDLDHRGRYVLTAAARLADDGEPWALDVADGAALRRPLDLARVGERIASCGRVGLVARDRSTGRVRRVPIGCGLRLCPVCLRARGARTLARWAPVIEAAAADGAVWHHVTLTQRADVRPGGAVLREEAGRGWRGARPAGGASLRAVGGESLGSAYQRLRDSFAAVRQNRATRDAFFAGLGGYVAGFEATGRAARGGTPRWHVHAHILTCHPAGVTSAEVEAVASSWCRYGGKARSAQHIRRVEGFHGTVEVLKYPLKISDLTAAQLVEALAVWSGARLHQRGGAWYAHPRRPIPDPWRSWLACMAPRGSTSDVLHVWRSARPDPPDQLADPRASPVLFIGEDTGVRCFSWGPKGERFLADAATWATIAASDLPLVEPAGDGEPGDLDDELA